MTSTDLVVGYHKLDTEFFSGHVQHTTFRSDVLGGRRRVRVVKKWYRDREIGRGSFGTVFLERSEEGENRAVKDIAKNKNINIDYKRELIAMAILLKHDALFVQLFGWYESDNCVHIAMEYLGHGCLRDYLEVDRSESEAKVITRQLVEGLVVIHQEGFAHRDLKPENIFVVSSSPIWVKIGDFGLAKLARGGTAFRTQVLSLGYFAPEMGIAAGGDSSQYTNAVDIWALGCITHEMLTGVLPFPSLFELSRYCIRSEPPRKTMLSKRISWKGIEAVERMLVLLPEERIIAKEALDLAWLRLEGEGETGTGSAAIGVGYDSDGSRYSRGENRRDPYAVEGNEITTGLSGLGGGESSVFVQGESGRNKVSTGSKEVTGRSSSVDGWESDDSEQSYRQSRYSSKKSKVTSTSGSGFLGIFGRSSKRRPSRSRSRGPHGSKRSDVWVRRDGNVVKEGSKQIIGTGQYETRSERAHAIEVEKEQAAAAYRKAKETEDARLETLRIGAEKLKEQQLQEESENIHLRMEEKATHELREQEELERISQEKTRYDEERRKQEAARIEELIRNTAILEANRKDAEAFQAIEQDKERERQHKAEEEQRERQRKAEELREWQSKVEEEQLEKQRNAEEEEIIALEVKRRPEDRQDQERAALEKKREELQQKLAEIAKEKERKEAIREARRQARKNDPKYRERSIRNHEWSKERENERERARREEVEFIRKNAGLDEKPRSRSKRSVSFAEPYIFVERSWTVPGGVPMLIQTPPTPPPGTPRTATVVHVDPKSYFPPVEGRETRI